MLNETPDNIVWDYMVSYLQGEWRDQEGVNLFALVSAKAMGIVHPGVLHQKLTKPVK